MTYNVFGGTLNLPQLNFNEIFEISIDNTMQDSLLKAFSDRQ